jgi:hypothetical protein
MLSSQGAGLDVAAKQQGQAPDRHIETPEAAAGPHADALAGLQAAILAPQNADEASIERAARALESWGARVALVRTEGWAGRPEPQEPRAPWPTTQTEQTAEAEAIGPDQGSEEKASLARATAAALGAKPHGSDGDWSLEEAIERAESLDALVLADGEAGARSLARHEGVRELLSELSAREKWTCALGWGALPLLASDLAVGWSVAGPEAMREAAQEAGALWAAGAPFSVDEPRRWITGGADAKAAEAALRALAERVGQSEKAIEIAEEWMRAEEA